MHVHFAKIAYTKMGERAHVTFADSEFGPDFSQLAPMLIKYKLEPRIICESKGTMAMDACAMREIYNTALTEAKSCKFSDLKLWSVVHKHFRIPVVLVCETQDIPSTRYRLQSINWRFPVVYDTAGLFRTNNRISTPVLQTFLLDSGNHPLIVGNPIGNTQLWNLYEKEIARLTDIRER